jgi:hypothetical protein
MTPGQAALASGIPNTVWCQNMETSKKGMTGGFSFFDSISTVLPLYSLAGGSEAAFLIKDIVAQRRIGGKSL